MKKCLFIFLSIFLFLFYCKTSFAVSNFTTDYDVTYTVTDDQNTNVKINITLTNTSDIYYASSYKIQVGFNNVRKIKAFDSYGPIVPTVTTNASDKIIDLEFNDRTVGIGNKLFFSLSFDTKNIANKSGNLWEINIPGLAKQTDFDNFKAHVIVPKSFGQPSFIKPEIKDNPSLKNGSTFTFSKNDLGKSGISMTFGNEQLYEFNLTYHLENKNIYPVKTEIALPPSTNYQDIVIDDINPKPENVVLDKDKNWLAQYSLSSSQKTNVIVRGKAKVQLIPKKEVLSDNELKEYLKEKEYWEISNRKLSLIAKDLKTPREIYNYVVNKLNYDYSRVSEDKPRIGALKVLDNPSSAVCLEFTDLFIALARASGIPAREVNGFAYTRDSKERPVSLLKDILHAWPEYYDKEKQTWIMIDPTWGNTTGGIDYFDILDFDHIAFVIKGVESDYPVPAGGYKLENAKAIKDVNITFADGFENQNSTLQIYQYFSDTFLSGLPIQGSLLIKNISKNLSENNQIVIDTNFLQPTHQRIVFGKIPPFGYATIPIKFNKTSFLTNKTDNIKITLGETILPYNITLRPFYLNQLFLMTGGIFIFVVFTIVLSIYIIRTRNISFFRQKK